MKLAADGYEVCRCLTMFYEVNRFALQGLNSNFTTHTHTTGACIQVKNTVKKPEKPKFEVFEPNYRFEDLEFGLFRLEDLEFGLFELFSRISVLNTNSCTHTQK